MKISNKYNFSYECKKEIVEYYLNLNNDEIIFDLFSCFLNNISEIIIINNKIQYEFVTSYIEIIKLFKKYFSEEEIIIYVSNQKTLKYNSTKYKVLINPNSNKKVDLIKSKFLTSKKTKRNARAFLAGAFLSSGSISGFMNKNKHFEFRFNNESLFFICQSILHNFGIKFNTTMHHKKQIIYLKKIQDISDILKVLQASNSMLKFEEYRITSDFVNTCQRLNNLDISNLSKITKCNNELIQIIKKIKQNNKFYQLSENIKIYCELKLNNPTLSMSELLIELNKNLSKHVSKSWINHTNIKLRKIFNEINCNDAKNKL